MVKVYSNCETAELFVNGKSVGVKHRNSQDFPAAGLRWITPFVAGKNHISVIAKRGSITVTDEIEFIYQTEPWGPPVNLRLTEKKRDGNKITLEATLYDSKGILCLDARNQIRFSLAGSGQLIDNMGTPSASRVVQLANGRSANHTQTNLPGPTRRRGQFRWNPHCLLHNFVKQPIY